MGSSTFRWLVHRQDRFHGLAELLESIGLQSFIPVAAIIFWINPFCVNVTVLLALFFSNLMPRKLVNEPSWVKSNPMLEGWQRSLHRCSSLTRQFPSRQHRAQQWLLAAKENIDPWQTAWIRVAGEQHQFVHTTEEEPLIDHTSSWPIAGRFMSLSLIGSRKEDESGLVCWTWLGQWRCWSWLNKLSNSESWPRWETVGRKSKQQREHKFLDRLPPCCLGRSIFLCIYWFLCLAYVPGRILVLATSIVTSIHVPFLSRLAISLAAAVSHSKMFAVSAMAWS